MHNNRHYQTMSKIERKPDLTLVFIGFQGSGKSATGNSVLGRKCFHSGFGTIGTTKQVQMEETYFGDKRVSIVDTPPLSSTETFTAINNAFSKHQQTTAVYAIVIAIGRFTPDEKAGVGNILSKFGSILNGRTLLLFTRKNELEAFGSDEKNNLKSWLESTPTIQRWINNNNIPYFAIENESMEHDCGIDEMMKTAVNMNNPEKNCCWIL
ncbi:GTPase IMAP family member 6-like isoform X2 [Mytilus californianus]|uniref:GTPase IMAP family member 6-like isoform X2 n=1 Tax=Mytilus californianus TaxID=6549 RepID=UPI00224830F0|nr:GTPase IMAP family member 6-like isoform X2 [Mytilus californianus]